MPIAASVARIVGHVPSPTPIVGISGASISVIERRPVTARGELARRAAASQPAVPPPTMTTLSIASFIAVRPSISPASRKRATPVRARLLCYESGGPAHRSEEHKSELQSLMHTSSAVFSLKKKQHHNT